MVSCCVRLFGVCVYIYNNIYLYVMIVMCVCGEKAHVQAVEQEEEKVVYKQKSR